MSSVILIALVGVFVLVAVAVITIGVVALIKLGVITRYALKEEEPDQASYGLDQSQEPDQE